MSIDLPSFIAGIVVTAPFAFWSTRVCYLAWREAMDQAEALIARQQRLIEQQRRQDSADWWKHDGPVED